jgi:hypothetical protein
MHVRAVFSDGEIGNAECSCNCAAIEAASDQGKDFPLSRMVVCDRPVAAAMERIDQWVASFGVVFSVRSITGLSVISCVAGDCTITPPWRE